MGEGLVHTCKDEVEVVLESSDGAFCTIATMHLWGHQLKLGLPCEHDGLLVGSTGLIVEDLEIN
jgi:hypothetical protein